VGQEVVEEQRKVQPLTRTRWTKNWIHSCRNDNFSKQSLEEHKFSFFQANLYNVKSVEADFENVEQNSGFVLKDEQVFEPIKLKAVVCVHNKGVDKTSNLGKLA
jgi:hypothetical protein